MWLEATEFKLLCRMLLLLLFTTLQQALAQVQGRCTKNIPNGFLPATCQARQWDFCSYTCKEGYIPSIAIQVTCLEGLHWNIAPEKLCVDKQKLTGYEQKPGNCPGSVLATCSKRKCDTQESCARFCESMGLIQTDQGPQFACQGFAFFLKDNVERRCIAKKILCHEPQGTSYLVTFNRIEHPLRWTVPPTTMPESGGSTTVPKHATGMNHVGGHTATTATDSNRTIIDGHEEESGNPATEESSSKKSFLMDPVLISIVSISTTIFILILIMLVVLLCHTVKKRKMHKEGMYGVDSGGSVLEYKSKNNQKAKKHNLNDYIDAYGQQPYDQIVTVAPPIHEYTNTAFLVGTDIPREYTNCATLPRMATAPMKAVGGGGGSVFGSTAQLARFGTLDRGIFVADDAAPIADPTYYSTEFSACTLPRNGIAATRLR